jgi:tRNA-2-methylthio-N6-dimethylallyladenosine synthase
MNVNDSEHISGLLNQAGLKPVNSPEKSDLIIINTCAVREKSEEKLFSLLGRLRALKEKGRAIIGVAGCVAQLRREEIFLKAPHVDFIVGPDNYHRLNELVFSKARELATEWHTDWHELPAPARRTSSVSAYVTIMEGCNNFCTYCVVPFTRGREKYRPLPLIIDEVKKLADTGYQEIHLLGQNVNSYRDPLSGKDLVSLLEKVNQIEGIQWIRFITSHPRNFHLRLVEAMAHLDKVCHQLHLPIQSGSNKILALMRRNYTREEYLEKIAMLRELVPDVSLSTDIIVGFPGEEEEDFEQTLDILRQVRFDNIFSFRYSPRPRTAAAKLDDSVPLEIKKERLIKLQALQREIQLAQHKALCGRVMKVLCTGRSKKDKMIFSGRNEAYQVINFSASREVIGQFVWVKITDYGPYSLKGEMVTPENKSIL